MKKQDERAKRVANLFVKGCYEFRCDLCFTIDHSSTSIEDGVGGDVLSTNKRVDPICAYQDVPFSCSPICKLGHHCKRRNEQRKKEKQLDPNQN